MHSVDILIIFNVIVRFVLWSILEAILVRFGIYFGSFGGCGNWNFNIKTMWKLASKKNTFRGRPGTKDPSELVAKKEVRREVNLPPEGRRFGRKEEKKKGRKK